MSIVSEIKDAAGENLRTLGKCIVVIDGGFIQVGDVYIAGGEVLISKNKNIRRGNTTRGLGELINGPLKNTEIDEEGETIIPYGRVVKFLPVNAEKWK